MRLCVAICAPSRSLIQTSVVAPLRKSAATAAPQRTALRCATAVAELNTHCQQVCPSTRADVLSEAITDAARTSASMRPASTMNGSAARESILAMAP